MIDGSERKNRTEKMRDIDGSERRSVIGGSGRKSESGRMSGTGEIDEAHNPDYEAKRKGEWNTVRRRYVAIQESRWRGSVEGKSYFQRSHADYLASREWAERRSLVMDRATGLCEGCRKARATEVHHLSYRNWGSEFLFELVALCGDCHDRIHRLNEDRETGCTGCVHAGDDGEWCHQFGMPSGAASIPGGACGSDRQAFVDAEDYG